jgi:hypothetical protein
MSFNGQQKIFEFYDAEEDIPGLFLVFPGIRWLGLCCCLVYCVGCFGCCEWTSTVLPKSKSLPVPGSRQLLFRRIDSTGKCPTNGFRESKRLIIKLIAPLLKRLTEVGVIIRAPCVHCKVLLLMLFVCCRRETRVKPEKRHHVRGSISCGRSGEFGQV